MVGAGPCSPASSSCRMSTARGSAGIALPASTSGSASAPSSLSSVSEPWWHKAPCRQPAKAKRSRVHVADEGMPAVSPLPAQSSSQGPVCVLEAHRRGSTDKLRQHFETELRGSCGRHSSEHLHMHRHRPGRRRLLHLVSKVFGCLHEGFCWKQVPKVQMSSQQHIH